MNIRPFRDIKRRKTRKIKVGKVDVGGEATISVQSMTNTLTTDVEATIKQINKLTEAEETVIALIAALQDEDLNVRSNAASALGMLGEVAESAVPALIQVLNAPEARFRADAVAALGLIGTPIKLVISTLTQALDDQNQDVRQCALFHLERIGTFEALQAVKENQ